MLPDEWAPSRATIAGNTTSTAGRPTQPGGPTTGNTNGSKRNGHESDQKTRKAKVDEFIKNATIGAFDPGWIPPCTRPESFNNDLEMASFMPSRYTWAGEQRKGMVFHITDSIGPADHTRKAMGLEFSIAKAAPLPSEVTTSLDFNQNVTTEEATEFWTTQLATVREIVAAATKTQAQWEAAPPLAAT